MAATFSAPIVAPWTARRMVSIVCFIIAADVGSPQYPAEAVCGVPKNRAPANSKATATPRGEGWRASSLSRLYVKKIFIGLQIQRYLGNTIIDQLLMHLISEPDDAPEKSLGLG